MIQRPEKIGQRRGQENAIHVRTPERHIESISEMNEVCSKEVNLKKEEALAKRSTEEIRLQPKNHGGTTAV